MRPDLRAELGDAFLHGLLQSSFGHVPCRDQFDRKLPRGRQYRPKRRGGVRPWTESSVNGPIKDAWGRANEQYSQLTIRINRTAYAQQGRRHAGQLLERSGNSTRHQDEWRACAPVSNMTAEQMAHRGNSGLKVNN